MRCVDHVQMEAKGVCEICGRPFCEQCLVEVKGRRYCKEDLAAIADDARFNSQRPEPVININNSYARSGGYYPGYAGGFAASPPRSRLAALLLCIFLGVIGVHRFYVGKVGTGLLWFFTGGLFGIGWIVDIALISTDVFRDYYGRPLV